MSTLIRRRWVSLVLLSIIVPMGLLAAFRLTGIIPEPPTPETITLETVNWNMSRPADYLRVNEKIENSYSNNVAQINLEVYVDKYVETSSTFDYRDVLWLIVSTTANMSDGFIHSIAIKFSQTDAYAAFIVDKHPYFLRLDNLEIRIFRDLSTNEQEAYIEATAVDQPKNCSLKMMMNLWMFTDENDVNHWMTITLEVTYFNGASWERVRIPIQLGVLIS